jgi:hypothetical protein
MSICEGFIRGE